MTSGLLICCAKLILISLQRSSRGWKNSHRGGCCRFCGQAVVFHLLRRSIDLGLDPFTIERSLSELFRLANLWDCILLLDEAEIFLSQRERKDDNLQRNALVSSKWLRPISRQHFGPWS